jgi:DNA invertase Pin-like site-specific DNA recombinase
MTDVIAYSRVVPAPEQDKTLAHHRDRINAFCKQNNLNLLEVFEEVTSADKSLADRSQLLEALNNLKPGMALVVLRLNRLSGQRKLLTEIFDKCNTLGCSILTVEGPATLDEMQFSLEVSSI